MIQKVKRCISYLILLFLIISCRTTVKIHDEDEAILHSKGIKDKGENGKKAEYFLHKQIRTTYFYAGQHSENDPYMLNNRASAWSSDWVEAYGGIDTPEEREGYFPKGFVPYENPFYCALPYNDISKFGYKPDILTIIPWADELSYKNNDDFISYCKNRWIKIIYNDTICYAQWEDVGPFKTDDPDYVFGSARPENKKNESVGLDLSPACFHYLVIEGADYTDWQFVDFIDVPDGPWLDVISISNPRWN